MSLLLPLQSKPNPTQPETLRRSGISACWLMGLCARARIDFWQRSSAPRQAAGRRVTHQATTAGPARGAINTHVDCNPRLGSETALMSGSRLPYLRVETQLDAIQRAA
jgi:hypothetical protein